jgi:hypothetical protein
MTTLSTPPFRIIISVRRRRKLIFTLLPRPMALVLAGAAFASGSPSLGPPPPPPPIELQLTLRIQAGPRNDRHIRGYSERTGLPVLPEGGRIRPASCTSFDAS